MSLLVAQVCTRCDLWRGSLQALGKLVLGVGKRARRWRDKYMASEVTGLLMHTYCSYDTAPFLSLSFLLLREIFPKFQYCHCIVFHLLSVAPFAHVMMLHSIFFLTNVCLTDS